MTKKKNKKIDNRPFAERHPRWNLLIGFLMFLIIIAGSFFFAKWLVVLIIELAGVLIKFVKKFVSTTDKVIVVAMITGSVSIVGVVISSIVAKIVDYRYKVKKFLYDKREEPYKQFVEMIYKVMEDTNKPETEKLSEQELLQMISEFSKGLTLWGSNRVVKKWLKYRKTSLEGEVSLWELEEIIYEIRRDIGLGRKMKRGNMLSLFINDVENLKNKK